MHFIHPNDNNPADMLGNAASVVRFLADVTGELAGPGGNAGLSNEAANGLCLILLAVENTINRAVSGL